MCHYAYYTVKPVLETTCSKRPPALTLHLKRQFWALPIQQQIKIWTNRMQLPDWVENIVGKGEIASYEQFLLFPQCFQKLSVVDVSK